MHASSVPNRAPELQISRWFNTETPLSLEKLRGRPVLIDAFQMLCPGCVSQSLPQAQRVRSIFEKTDLQVIGLHSVFEHHDVMTPSALEAFLFEYRIGFPVGVDLPSEIGPIPKTMAAFKMRGTPTKILINRDGSIAASLFGQVDDLALGAMIQATLDQPSNPIPTSAPHSFKTEGCTP